jgi:hypothetical protein
VRFRPAFHAPRWKAALDRCAQLFLLRAVPGDPEIGHSTRAVDELVVPIDYPEDEMPLAWIVSLCRDALGH